MCFDAGGISMIRAVVKNGAIQPVEPLPADWKEGRQLVVEDFADQKSVDSDDFDRWAEDMKILTAELDNPQEWQDIEAALVQADRLNKALVRKEMGLP
jgi:hypothetical protein